MAKKNKLDRVDRQILSDLHYDPDVKAIVPKMRRGDLDKMSFAFV